MYKKSTSSLLADCSILSLITIRQKIAIRTEFIGLMSIVILALGLMFMPVLSMAEQVETTISCNEGSEPTGITYGDRTTDCAIDPPTDLDRFEFCGTIGDEVRLNVFAATYWTPWWKFGIRRLPSSRRLVVLKLCILDGYNATG